jgi:hypothetical protein
VLAVLFLLGSAVVIGLMVQATYRETEYDKKVSQYTDTPFINACNALNGKLLTLENISTLKGYCINYKPSNCRGEDVDKDTVNRIQENISLLRHYCISGSIGECDQQTVDNYNNFWINCSKFLTPKALSYDNESLHLDKTIRNDYEKMASCTLKYIYRNHMGTIGVFRLDIREHNSLDGTWNCSIKSSNPKIIAEPHYIPHY